MGAAALAIAALIGCAVLGMQVSSRNATIAKQKLENLERPIAPSTRKRTILVGVARNGPPAQPTLTISHGEFAELKADLSWARYGSFKVSIDRVNQGRVAVLDGLEKDSNGHLRISLNAGAFGPGDYMVSIEGLNMRRESMPIAWYRVSRRSLKPRAPDQGRISTLSMSRGAVARASCASIVGLPLRCAARQRRGTRSMAIA